MPYIFYPSSCWAFCYNSLHILIQTLHLYSCSFTLWKSPIYMYYIYLLCSMYPRNKSLGRCSGFRQHETFLEFIYPWLFKCGMYCSFPLFVLSNLWRCFSYIPCHIVSVKHCIWSPVCVWGVCPQVPLDAGVWTSPLNPKWPPRGRKADQVRPSLPVLGIFLLSVQELMVCFYSHTYISTHTVFYFDWQIDNLP